MIQPTRKSRAIVTIQKSDVRMRAQAATRAELGARSAAAADEDAMSGSICSPRESARATWGRRPGGGAGSEGAVVGPHIFFDEISKTMISFKLGGVDRG